MSRGSAFSQILQPADPFEIEVIGRLVEQQHVGLLNQNAGQQGEPLPAAAQVFQRLLPQRLGHLERFQRHIDAPAFACLLFDGQRLEHRGTEWLVHQRGWHILLHIADGQPA